MPAKKRPSVKESCQAQADEAAAAGAKADDASTEEKGDVVEADYEIVDDSKT